MIANASAAAPREVERFGELLVEARPVRQLGQHVVVREPVDLLDRVRALGGVLDRAGDADRAAFGAPERFAEHVQVNERAVGACMRRSMPLGCLAVRDVQDPAPERAAIVGVDELDAATPSSAGTARRRRAAAGTLLPSRRRGCVLRSHSQLPMRAMRCACFRWSAMRRFALFWRATASRDDLSSASRCRVRSCSWISDASRSFQLPFAAACDAPSAAIDQKRIDRVPHIVQYTRRPVRKHADRSPRQQRDDEREVDDASVPRAAAARAAATGRRRRRWRSASAKRPAVR